MREVCPAAKMVVGEFSDRHCPVCGENFVWKQKLAAPRDPCPRKLNAKVFGENPQLLGRQSVAGEILFPGGSGSLQ